MFDPLSERKKLDGMIRWTTMNHLRLTGVIVISVLAIVSDHLKS